MGDRRLSADVKEEKLASQPPVASLPALKLKNTLLRNTIEKLRNTVEKLRNTVETLRNTVEKYKIKIRNTCGFPPALKYGIHF